MKVPLADVASWPREGLVLLLILVLVLVIAAALVHVRGLTAPAEATEIDVTPQREGLLNPPGATETGEPPAPDPAAETTRGSVGL